MSHAGGKPGVASKPVNLALNSSSGEDEGNNTDIIEVYYAVRD